MLQRSSVTTFSSDRIAFRRVQRASSTPVGQSSPTAEPTGIWDVRTAQLLAGNLGRRLLTRMRGAEMRRCECGLSEGELRCRRHCVLSIRISREIGHQYGRLEGVRR